MEEMINSRPQGVGGPFGTAVEPDRVRVPAALRDELLEAGFRPRDTGDGMAWNRRDGDGTHVMIFADRRPSAGSADIGLPSADPSEVGLSGSPDAAEWTAGRYGDAGGFIEVTGLTLRAALDAVAVLPMPVRVDGSLAEAIYPSLDEAMSDLA